jgi:hypothetical protein
MASTDQSPPPTSSTSSNSPDRNGDLLKSLVEILLKKEHAAKGGFALGYFIPLVLTFAGSGYQGSSAQLRR